MINPKSLAPKETNFGTGHSEGVIAAEAANNAMVGPSLVPLLTLSIPGSPTAAVLLGGLLIHGIFPGSDLFDNHPDVAWTFINSMLIGQVLMCVFGLYVAGLAASVARVPHSVMAAVVLGLAVFGSYSVQNSMGDVYVMASLGVAMYFLERFGFSACSSGSWFNSWPNSRSKLYSRIYDCQCHFKREPILLHRPS